MLSHSSFREAQQRKVEKFMGVMIDPKSNFSCHGERQRHAYVQNIGRKAPFSPRSSGSIGSLGGSSAVVGLVNLAFPLDSRGSCATFVSRETNATAPILLGKHDLLRLGLKLDMDCNIRRGPSGLIPLVSQRGHLFVLGEALAEDSFFTQDELPKLHVKTGHVG